MKKLLTKDPNQRLGAAGISEIKNHPFLDTIDWKKLLNKKTKAPYKPKINLGEVVKNQDSEYSNGESDDHPNNQDTVDRGTKIDVFGGFSFVASHIRSGNDEIISYPGDIAPAPEPKSNKFSLHSSSLLNRKEKKKSSADKIYIEYLFEFQRADGLAEKLEGSQYYIKWGCQSKKVNDGKTYAALCTSRAIQWSLQNGDVQATFITTMYLRGNQFDERIFTISLREKTTNKEVGSIKLNLADYSNHLYNKQQIFSISKHATICCNCSATWLLFNGFQLNFCESLENKNIDSLLKLNQNYYELLPPTEHLLSILQQATGSKKSDLIPSNSSTSSNISSSSSTTSSNNVNYQQQLEQQQFNYQEESSSLRKRVSSTSKSILSAATGKRKHKRTSSVAGEHKEEEVVETEDSNSKNKDKKLRRTQSAKISKADHDKNKEEEEQAQQPQKTHQVAVSGVGTLVPFTKRKGLNKIQVAIKIKLNKIQNIPLKYYYNTDPSLTNSINGPVKHSYIFLTWRCGSKPHNQGTSKKFAILNDQTSDLTFDFDLKCSLYQNQQPPFHFDEKNILFSLKIQSESGKKFSVGKTIFNLSKFATDESEHEEDIEFKNSKSKSTIKLSIHSHTNWLSINDEPITKSNQPSTPDKSETKKSKRLSIRGLKMSSSSSKKSKQSDIIDNKESNDNLQGKGALEIPQGSFVLEQSKWDELQHKLKEYESKDKKLEEEVQQSKEEVRKGEETNNQLKTKVEELSVALERVENQLKTFKEMNKETENQKIKSLHEYIEKLNTENKQLTNEKNDIKSEYEKSVDAQKVEFQKKLEKLEKSNKNLKKKNQDLLKSNQTISDENLFLREQSLKRQNSSGTADTPRGGSNTSLPVPVPSPNISTSPEYKELNGKYQQLQQENKEMISKNTELLNKQKINEEKISEMSKEMNNMKNQLNNEKEKSDRLLNELNKIKQAPGKVSHGNDYEKIIHEKNEIIENLRNQVDYLKKQEELIKEKNKITGFEKIEPVASQNSEKDQIIENLKEQIEKLNSKLHKKVKKITNTSSESEGRDNSSDSSSSDYAVEGLDNDRMRADDPPIVFHDDPLSDIKLPPVQGNSKKEENKYKLMQIESNLSSSDNSSYYPSSSDDSESSIDLDEFTSAFQDKNNTKKTKGDSSKDKKNKGYKKIESDDEEERAGNSNARSIQLHGSTGASVISAAGGSGNDKDKMVKNLLKDTEEYNRVMKENKTTIEKLNKEIKKYKFRIETYYHCKFEYDKEGQPQTGTKLLEILSSINVKKEEDIDEFIDSTLNNLLKYLQSTRLTIEIVGYWLQCCCSIYNTLQVDGRFQFLPISLVNLLYSIHPSPNNKIQRKLEQIILLSHNLLLIYAVNYANFNQILLPAFLSDPAAFGNHSNPKYDILAQFFLKLDEIVGTIRSIPSLDQIIYKNLLGNIFKYINAKIFNEILGNVDLCNLVVGFNIKIILSHVYNWLLQDKDKKLYNYDIIEELKTVLLPLTQLADALAILPSPESCKFATVQDIFETFPDLTLHQIYNLIINFNSNATAKKLDKVIPQPIQKLVEKEIKVAESEANNPNIKLKYPFNENLLNQ